MTLVFNNGGIIAGEPPDFVTEAVDKELINRLLGFRFSMGIDSV